MRIVFLCKRRYMSKDVILDRYARLYEIPYQLAKIGHEVQAFCLDYHAVSTSSTDHTVDHVWQHDAAPGRLSWSSYPIGRNIAATLAMLAYPSRLLRELQTYRPDVIIGASDIPHVAMTGWLARRLQVPYVIDLYDNFEGFGQAKIPGFVRALRRTTQKANLVITTSEPLREKVLTDYAARGAVVSMPSSVNLQLFHPGQKEHARSMLGLPLDAKLIGTAGGLTSDKGIEPLYAAWQTLSIRYPQLHLVLAGPFNPSLPPPSGARVHYLGMLDHVKVPDLFRALDIGIISIPDTPFGRYCFPQKAYEMLACNLDVVVSDVGEMASLFSEVPEALFPAGDAKSLDLAISRRLDFYGKNKHLTTIQIDDWEALIKRIEPKIRAISSTP